SHEIIYASSGLSSHWLDRLLGAPLSEEHRRQGELFLLAAASSLLAFLIVAATASAVPRLMIRWRFGPAAWPSGLEQILVTGVCFLGAILLLRAIVSLLRAFR